MATLSKILPINKKRSIVKSIAGFLLLFGFLWSLFILWNTNQLLTSVKSNEIQNSIVYAQRIQPTFGLLNTLTFKTNKDLDFASTTLGLILTVQRQQVDISKTLQQVNDPNQEFNYDNFRDLIDPLSTDVEYLSNIYPKTWLVKKFITLNQLNSAKNVLLNVGMLLDFLESGNRTFVVLLQNSDELRATGGFPGSFAFIHTFTNQPPDIQILDIYVPDGQFEGFVQPPPGLEKYLSSGNGLRLPDANWYPDFPTSATQMLRFFAYGDTPKIDVIATINLSLLEKMLKVIGPIYLADYDQTITAENLTTIARADRDSFFAGSQQKTNFLNSLATQLRYQLNQLSIAQQKTILEQVIAGAQQKQIQIYSPHSAIQNLVEELNIDGRLISKGDLGIYLVESNVGINKANSLVERNVEIDVSDYRTQLTVTFDNQNSAAPLPGETTRNYINYYRIFTHPEVEVTKVSINNQPTTFEHSRGFVTTNSDTFLETGVLVEVPTKQKTQVIFTLEHKQLPANPDLFIFHQSGLPPTPYSIKYLDRQQNLLIESDTTLSPTN